LVQFWFKTGCRPSEAIGLQWKHISPNCDFITFEGSIQCIAGKLYWSEGSKNNKTRTIAVSESVRNLLLQIRPDVPNSDSPVFPSPKGKFINYENFCKRVWSKVVHPIVPKTTPYNCRDTFITEQLLKGVSPAVIAKWCDTSTKMIEEHYADKLRLSAIRPID
jgi:integrase